MKVAAHDRLLQPALDKLKLQSFGVMDPSDVILHRREIVRREGPFAVLRDDARQRAFDESILGNH